MELVNPEEVARMLAKRAANRRKGERRCADIPVETERRSGSDRRSGIDRRAS